MKDGCGKQLRRARCTAERERVALAQKEARQRREDQKARRLAQEVERELRQSQWAHVITRDSDKLSMCKLDMEGTFFVAFDMEGMHLGRTGETALVQLAIEVDIGYPSCYMFDMLRIGKDAKRFLKDVLESAQLLKIVHDCRVDSEALKTHHGIVLRNVHDTQVCHQLRFPNSSRLSLNDTLSYYGLPLNTARDKDVYKTQNRVWLKRPLTDRMVQWASADVYTPVSTLRQAAGADTNHERSCSRPCSQ